MSCVTVTVTMCPNLSWQATVVAHVQRAVQYQCHVQPAVWCHDACPCEAKAFIAIHCHFDFPSFFALPSLRGRPLDELLDPGLPLDVPQ